MQLQFKINTLSEKMQSLGRETQKKFLEFCIEMFRQALLINYETKSLVYFEPTDKLENHSLMEIISMTFSKNFRMRCIMWNETETIILTDLSININTLNPKIIV
jgi:DNA polymerase-3 subunit delta'